jgi:MFS family permease
MSNVPVRNDTTSPNAQRLLWAGFVAILAAGVGFALRGGIFDNWSREFGFTATQLGAIGGAGFTGFCFGIIGGGVIADKIGYGKLVIAAFACHVLSAFVTFGATSPENAYLMLTWGMFIFAFANGVQRSSPTNAPTTSTSCTPAGPPVSCSAPRSVGFSTTRCR